MFTTSFPIYPAKVRGFADQALKVINGLVFVGVWACLVWTINDVARKARNTLSDFWTPGDAQPKIAERLLQRLDSTQCSYAASVDIGDLTVTYNMTSANRDFLFAEGAGLIRTGVLVSCAAVFLSALNRVAFNYNWHALQCGRDSNFYAPKGYLLLLEAAAIIWAIVALVHPQDISEYLRNYIQHCGAADIPHLFEAPPFVAMFIAHGITLFAYLVNWFVFWIDAIRPLDHRVEQAWAEVVQVLEMQSRPEKDRPGDPWTRDDIAGRPMLEHVEARLKELLNGMLPIHGFVGSKGLRHKLWEKHGFPEKLGIMADPKKKERRQRLQDEEAEELVLRPGGLPVPNYLVIRGCPDWDANGVYVKIDHGQAKGHGEVEQYPQVMWRHETDVNAQPLYTDQNSAVVWTLFHMSVEFAELHQYEDPLGRTPCWLLSKVLSAEEQVDSGLGGQQQTRMWRTVAHEESPVGAEWEEFTPGQSGEDAEGQAWHTEEARAPAARLSVTGNKVATPLGPGTIVRPAGVADLPRDGSFPPAESLRLPDHWWVHLDRSGPEPDPQERSGVSAGNVLLPWRPGGVRGWVDDAADAAAQQRDAAAVTLQAKIRLRDGDDDGAGSPRHADAPRASGDRMASHRSVRHQQVLSPHVHQP